jgi:hypothetical protein
MTITDPAFSLPERSCHRSGACPLLDIDCPDEIGHGHLATGRDGLERRPEGVLQADTDLVTSNHDRANDNTRFHCRPRLLQPRATIWDRQGFFRPGIWRSLDNMWSTLLTLGFLYYKQLPI